MERLEYERVEIDNPNELVPYRYQPFINLEPERYEALKESIRTHGIEEEIWVDEDNAIIDGHQRHRAWLELEQEGVDIRPVCARRYKATDLEDFWITAVRKNMQRRQLKDEEMQQVIGEHLKYLARYYEENPPAKGKPPYSDADKRICRFLGVSASTVARVRRKLEATGDIPYAQTLISTRPFGSTAILNRAKVQEAVKRFPPEPGDSREHFTVVAPDGEVIEALTPEELQEKLSAYLAEEDQRFDQAQESYRAWAQEEIKKAEEQFWSCLREDVTKYLEDVIQPEQVERLEDVPVKVWDEAVENAIRRRQLRMDKAMIAGAGPYDSVMQLDPDEIAEAMLRASEIDRDRYLQHYRALGVWYAGVAEVVQRRLENPVAGLRSITREKDGGR